MGRFRRFVPLAILALALSGCSWVAGQAQPHTWLTSSSFQILRSIPADDQTLSEIELVDVGRVNTAALQARQSRLGTSSSAPSSSTSTSASATTTDPSAAVRRLEQDDLAWTNLAFAGYRCDPQSYSMTFRRPTDPAGPTREVLAVAMSTTFAPEALVVVCQQERTPSTEKVPGTARTVAGLPGTDDEVQWSGYRAQTEQTYLLGVQVPASVAESIVGGTPATGSVADDPRVQAVLQAVGPVAMVSMGTLLLQNGFNSGDRVKAAIADAERTAGSSLPRASFAAMAWTPDHGAAGTLQMLTSYPSDQQAAAAAAVLTQIWRAGSAGDLWSGATTAASGSLVITTLSDADPSRYGYTSFGFTSYPGFFVER